MRKTGAHCCFPDNNCYDAAEHLSHSICYGDSETLDLSAKGAKIVLRWFLQFFFLKNKQFNWILDKNRLTYSICLSVICEIQINDRNLRALYLRIISKFVPTSYECQQNERNFPIEPNGNVNLYNIIQFDVCIGTVYTAKYRQLVKVDLCNAIQEQSQMKTYDVHSMNTHKPTHDLMSTKKFLIRRQSLMSHWTTYYCCLLRVLANKNHPQITCFLQYFFSLPYIFEFTNKRMGADKARAAAIYLLPAFVSPLDRSHSCKQTKWKEWMKRNSNWAAIRSIQSKKFE